MFNLKSNIYNLDEINPLFHPVIIPKPSSPVRNYKENRNDRLGLSGEHDTAGENPALVVRRDHYLAVVFF